MSRHDETSAWHRLVASAAGSLVAETCTLPTDVAKTRMQVNAAGRYSAGFVSVMVDVQRTEGLAALWKGLQPALVRQLCYTCTALVLYQPIRNMFASIGHRRGGSGGEEAPQMSFGHRLAAGGSAGAVAIAIFNPAEVVKTQMQSATHTRTAWDVMSTVWRRHGIRGFWAGLTPNLARTFLVNAARLGSCTSLQSSTPLDDDDDDGVGVRAAL